MGQCHEIFEPFISKNFTWALSRKNRFRELRSNIFAITIKFAKPCLSLHMRPKSNLLSKKMVENLATLSL